jgi:hypothetical protein
MSSAHIHSYPEGYCRRICYILLLFVKEIVGCKARGQIQENNRRRSEVKQPFDSIPCVNVLTYYEWIRDSKFEIFFAYLMLSLYFCREFNPLPLLIAILTSNWLAFLVATVAMYVFAIKFAEIYESAQAGLALNRGEIEAVQRTYQRRIREARTNQGQVFTKSLVRKIRTLKQTVGPQSTPKSPPNPSHPA